MVFQKTVFGVRRKGMYKYSFTAAPAWENKKVKIVFEGVMTDADVKINGQPAGEIHQGAFYAFKYDISSLLKYGEQNLLEVTVAKHSANSSVNEAERKADFWIFGGIFRPVYLEILPQTFIENVAINAKADGSFKAELNIEGSADKIVAQLYTTNGVKFGSAITTSTVSISSRFTAPKLWTPESPDLYKVVFSIYKSGRLLHSTEQKFGFRTVEVKKRDGIYVNGVKVKMKGVNRHSFRPENRQDHQ
jgi:beta-galactosidase/beta-glucuronidase